MPDMRSNSAVADRSKYAGRTEHLAQICHGLYGDVPTLRPGAYVARRRKRGEAWSVVDVRDEDKRQISTLPGAVSVAAFEADPAAYSAGPILVYCTAGCKSGAYARQLRARGHRAYNLWGGVLAWALGGRLFVDPAGGPTRDVALRGLIRHALRPSYRAIG
jgi:rhodanese-related sulfurtransferase